MNLIFRIRLFILSQLLIIVLFSYSKNFDCISYRTLEPLPVSNIKDKIDSIISFSCTFLGTPYRYGGTTPKGFDCSGFIVYVFNNFAIKMPRTGSGQYHEYKTYSILDQDIRKGDLVFFEGRHRNNRIGHVGMVISDTVENEVFSFIHSSVNNGIIISQSNEPYYKKRYMYACRVFRDVDNKIDYVCETDIESVISDTLYHFVRKGETLYSIFRKYNTTVIRIKKDNVLENDLLKIGQKLKITQK